MKSIRFTFLSSPEETALLDALSWKLMRFKSEVVRFAIRKLAEEEDISDGEAYLKAIDRGEPYPWESRYSDGEVN